MLAAVTLAALSGAALPALAGASLAGSSAITLPTRSSPAPTSPTSASPTSTSPTPTSTSPTSTATSTTSVSTTAPSPGTPPGAPGVSLTLGVRHLGWVSAALGGPAGTRVSLSESDRAGHRHLSTVTLAGTGHTGLPHLLVDSCSVRTRTVTTAASGSAAVTATVTTPACTNRLAVSVAGTAQITRASSLTLRDRWRVGELPVSVCLEPPGGDLSCHRTRLALGRAAVQLPLVLPRIGGWRVSAQVPGGTLHETTVWAGHPGPVRLLAAGDSEMQVLDNDLAQDLAPYDVAVTSAAYPSTGLTVPGQLNWQTRARRLVRTLKPDISIVAMGANEGYAITPPSGPAADCCGLAWTAGYGQLVTTMARTLLQGQGATALWFELAAPKPPPFARVLSAVNVGIRDAAHALPGRLGLVDANAYFTPGNRYRNRMTVDGTSFTIHEPDGIHLDATADEYAAKLVLGQLLADRVIR